MHDGVGHKNVKILPGRDELVKPGPAVRRLVNIRALDQPGLGDLEKVLWSVGTLSHRAVSRCCRIASLSRRDVRRGTMFYAVGFEALSE